MTQHKHLKRRVRQRMLKTGESYASARRIVLAQAPTGGAQADPWMHVAGSVPAATALRVLLTSHGIRAPHTGQPLSEAMAFGLAGGIGVGMFVFHYAKEGFSSFFVAGRHRWDDDQGYLEQAIGRLGCAAEVREATGARKAAVALDEMLQAGHPVVAWVDAGSLPYRSMPAEWSGGGYHVVVVYAVDTSAGLARIGDLADAPIELPLQALGAARARIVKFKNRLLCIASPPASFDLESTVRDGLRACHAGLTVGRSSSFTLEGLRNWSEQLAATGKEGWRTKFANGANLWRGLTSVHDFIEHYGTGGGLCRPLFAEFLQEAAEATGRADLADLAGAYVEIGRGWSALAEAALPDEVEPFHQAKQLLGRKAELFLSEGASGREAYQAIWEALGALATRAAEAFPLPQAAVHDLFDGLSVRVAELHRREVEAAAALKAAAS